MKKQPEDYAAELQKSHDQWTDIFEHGCHDPFWSDGVDLNLVHNHILYYRRKIEENFAPENYPEIYFKEVPPEVGSDYMARSDEIRSAARQSLAAYKASPDYQYIRRHRDDFTPKTQQKLSLDNVLHYATGLEQAIASDDLVAMRRHENADYDLKVFTDCARRMKETPAEDVQLSLFSFSGDGPDALDDGESDEDDGEEEDEGFGGMVMM